MPTVTFRGVSVTRSENGPATDLESPTEQGFRWPAEWESHEATWLSWPHNQETWPGRMAAVERAFVAIVRALHEREKVCIGVNDAAMENAVRSLLAREGLGSDSRIGCHVIPTDDAWIRDHGPLFLVRDSGKLRERAVMDFGYNAWGGKYPPWDRDTQVSGRIASLLGLHRFRTSTVLEGGSIEGNGHGMLMTTESCLLNPNRGAGRTRDSIEQLLRANLGVERVLWLAQGIVGDDTDGHVDNLARFVAPDVAVASFEDDVHDPNYPALAENFSRLVAAAEGGGRKLSVVKLPMPPPLIVDGARFPASYANFYLANEVVLMPRYGAPSDVVAAAVLGELFPEREIVGIPSCDLVIGLGSVHCLTQQEPSRKATEPLFSPEGAKG